VRIEKVCLVAILAFGRCFHVVCIVFEASCGFTTGNTPLEKPSLKVAGMMGISSSSRYDGASPLSDCFG